MKLMSKTAAAAAILAAGAVPAVASAHNPDGKGQQEAESHQTERHADHGQHGSKRCGKPTVAKGFAVSGAYTTWTGVQDDAADPTSTWSGTLTLTVTHANHHAKGIVSPFTFSHAKVTFDSPTATAPAAGDRVKIIGKIVVAKKKCANQATSATPGAGTYTVRKVVFSAPSAD